MSLSSDLISQFVKATKDEPQAKKEQTVYGTISVDENDNKFVKLDGSDISTPVSSTVDVKDGDRVIVMVKNHTATVTGNLSSPSARTERVEIVEETVTRMVTTDMLNATEAEIKELISEKASIEQLETESAKITALQAVDVEITNRLTTSEADIDDLDAKKIDADTANAKFATIENLNTTNASIKELDAKKMSTETANITFANIDFSNIGNAAMEYLYSQSGLIENVLIGNGTISGYLVGVTIRGDVIGANTIMADKLVIRGEDGLYYKLNTDGVTTEAEQTEYNSLNGQVILAKSITATQISVSDLVAFDATIGGFVITDDAIYSEVKDDEGNTTRGIYLGADGQINFGDGKNYVKYYRADDGSYKLAISADTILYDINGKQHSLEDLGIIGEYVKISTYEGEPCIELGETDSDFKLRITNTRILFMEGTGVPAYFTNQSMHIKKAVIEEELQQGEFVWKVRANGNLGLMWKGGN